MSNTQIHSALESLRTTFSSSAQECIDDFFTCQSTIKTPWEVVNKTNFEFDIAMILPASNEEFKTVLCAGIDLQSLRSFIGKNTEDEISPVEAYDSLGELLNNYCAVLNDNRKFQEKFDILRQSPPALFQPGSVFMKLVSAVQGYVYVDNKYVYLSFNVSER